MKNLEQIAEQLEETLDEKDTVREIAIKSSRAIIRLSSAAVHQIHKDEDVEGQMREAADEASRLRSLLEDHPDLLGSGLVDNAMQEIAEACILYAIVNDDELPSPEELGISAAAYLMGFADAIGELRRFTLESLRSGDIDQASDYLDMMEEMFLILMRFDYPKALVAIRRKQDIARSLVEKTRGDVTMSMNSKSLERKITELKKKL